MVSDNLTTNDWQQIALFYQNKAQQLEMQVLQYELAAQKGQVDEDGGE